MDYDKIKIRQGEFYQQAAKSAFDRGNFEQAYHFYIDAEDIYRQGYDTPRDRVFFMQSSALRCLEEILDDRPDLLNAYRTIAESFLQEWTESKISTTLSSGRVQEALAFRMWRDSYFKGVDEFGAASIAVEQSDLEKARQILDGFIQRMERNADPLSDALCAVARSKREMIAVREERQKPEDRRDLHTIALGFLRAARVSMPPKGSSSRQHQRIAAFRAWYLSDALKFRAFALLPKEHVPKRVTVSLAKAEKYLARAIKYANKGITVAGATDFPRTHVEYLTYWHEIVSERLHLLLFMVGGDDTEFELALKAWQKALSAAEQLSKQYGEESIFPNRFYSLKDLRIESFFLDAARAFRERRWPDCIALLEGWQQEFPKWYSWSWRDINVRIRLLGTKAIQALLNNDYKELSDLCKELMKISLLEPVGPAAQYFAEEVQRLPEKMGQRNLLNLVLDSLPQYFTLDSHVDTYQRPSEIDLFTSLPQRIYRTFRLLPPLDETEVEQLKAEVLSGLEALMGYMCDYYAQIFSLTEAPKPGIRSLVEHCSQFPWAKPKAVKDNLKKLGIAVDELHAAKETQVFANSYEKIRGTLFSLLSFVPVLIDIKSNTLRTEEPKAIEAFPDWLINRPGRQRCFIFVRPEMLSAIKVGRYYLPPDWHIGNRISYWVNERQPLIPVRYEPRWNFWDKEVEAIKLGITTLFRECVAGYLVSSGPSGLSVRQEYVLGPGSPPLDIYWEYIGEGFVIETKFSFTEYLGDERALAQLRRGKENARRFAPHLTHRAILVTNANSFAPNIQAAVQLGEIEIWVVTLRATPGKILKDPRSMKVEGIKCI